MDGTRLRLLQVRGIPIYIDLSWLIVLALVTLSLGGEFHTMLKARGIEVPTLQLWTMAVVTALGFFACIVLHELGHALVGRANGVPFSGITLFLFGGVAELRREPPSAGSEFRMAIAGPAVTAVLAGLFWSLSLVGDSAGWPVQVLLVLDYLVFINIAVLVFNLVPAFPLDGGRVFRAAAWAWTGDLRRATRWASASGRGFGWMLTFLGVLELFSGLILPGIWLVFIGMFLTNLARQSYEAVVTRELLAGLPVSQFMTREPITVSPDLDLRHLVEDFVYRHHRKAFPVSSNGHVAGLITTEALQKIPREGWERHTVADVMERDIDRITVSSDTEAVTALQQMQRTGSTRLLVVDDGQLAGVVSLRDLIDYLDMKIAVEPGLAN